TAPGRAGHLAEIVARESAGHPLFLRELARTVHLRTNDEAHLTLDGVLRARLAAFSAPALRALRALAIAGAPTPLRALVAVVSGESGAPGAGGALLDELRAAKLVHSTPGAVDDLVDIAHD